MICTKHIMKNGLIGAMSAVLVVGILSTAIAKKPEPRPEREIYGVDSNTKRMIDIYAPCDFEALLQDSGLTNADGTPITVPECASGSTTKFNIVAVSGTLEEGFPLRGNLDFNEDGETVNSIFLGKALIRGLRANLDIKSPGWREFKAEPALNPVNPGMVATGNRNDANIYSVYGIDRRQAVKALLNEPRFLSMTPDSAFVDRNAEETSQTIKSLITNQIINDDDSSITNNDEATLLTVVSVWDSCHFVPSPVLYTKSDGTRVTDFPNSLAAFAGVTDQLREDDPDAYNAAVEVAIRQAVEDTADCETQKGNGHGHKHGKGWKGHGHNKHGKWKGHGHN